VIFLARDAKKEQSGLFLVLTATSSKAEKKPGERDVRFTFGWPGQSRIADYRRRVAGPAATLVGKAPTGQRRPQAGMSRRRTLEKAGWGSGPVPDSREFRRRPLDRDGAGEGRIYLGRQSRHGRSARTISTNCATSSFRDKHGLRWKAFKADQADWISENSAKQWATAYDFPAVGEKAPW